MRTLDFPIRFTREDVANNHLPLSSVIASKMTALKLNESSDGLCPSTNVCSGIMTFGSTMPNVGDSISQEAESIGGGMAADGYLS